MPVLPEVRNEKVVRFPRSGAAVEIMMKSASRNLVSRGKTACLAPGLRDLSTVGEIWIFASNEVKSR